jgi:hypothetical protein
VQFSDKRLAECFVKKFGNGTAHEKAPTTTTMSAETIYDTITFQT